MEQISEIIEKLHLSVREAKHYSFGTFAECENLFVSLFKEVDKTIIKFEMVPEYIEILKWMQDNKGKGLALFGSLGRGKTIINSFIIPILFYQKYKKVLKPINAISIDNNYFLKWAHVIDDIGVESMVNDFGTKMDMVAMIINDAENYLKPLFLTSNLSQKELIIRYGIRTIDRIERLCKVVIFTGESLRN